MGKQILNQIIAVANGKKSEAKNDLTKVYQGLSKAELLVGLSRTYRPLDEEGERFPSEAKLVQVRVTEVLAQVSKILTGLFDVVVTQDTGNTLAKANVEVDGKTILTDVPVTSLLFLEKQLTDIHTVMSSLPTYDPSYDWHWDDAKGVYVSASLETAKTKKIPFRFEKAPATDRHPAQVEVMYEDRVTGYWSKTDFSGALSPKEKREYVERVRKLRDAVVKAREAANTQEINGVAIGKPIFEYLFAKVN